MVINGLTMRRRTVTSRTNPRLAFVISAVLLGTRSISLRRKRRQPCCTEHPEVKVVATVTVSPTTLSLTVGNSGLLTATTEKQ